MSVFGQKCIESTKASKSSVPDQVTSNEIFCTNATLKFSETSALRGR